PYATVRQCDMQNLLIAAGADIRRDETDELPTGNVDLAPTVLRILGIESPAAMDGRILTEAMSASETAPSQPAKETMETTKKFPEGTWRQHLQISRIGSTTYFDEGNGAFTR